SSPRPFSSRSCTSSGLAAPWPASLKHATNRLRIAGRGLQLSTTFGEGIEHPLRQHAEASIEDRALAFIQADLDVPADAVSFKCSCAGEVSDHVFVRQAIVRIFLLSTGSPLPNALTNVAFNKDDKSVVRLTHVMQIQNAETNVWLEPFVDAHTGDVLSLTDFVAKTSYLVLPIQKEILTQGGNNAISFKGAQTATTAQSSAGLVFNYPQSATTAPTTTANINAARFNAFHIVNSYGFTEAGFDFQNNDVGEGGARNGRISISVQNSAGIDGQSGAMRMFLWDLTNPERDGALENDIVTYKVQSPTRMSGGRTDRCLKTTEAGGMGEGRSSDAMADWNEKTTSAVPDYVPGSYVINDPTCIRSHPYSTSATVNPLRYSSLRTPTEVHGMSIFFRA
ncbi:Fungalysin metallopeptidase-domain-containing protein, partial [Mycena olivaceomarginata]